MRKITICLTVLCTMTVAANADERLKGIACRSVHLGFSAPEGMAFYNEIRVTNSAPGTYFMVCGFRMGYFGIQELGNGKKVVLFSVWDPGRQNNPNATPQERRVRVLFKGKDVLVRRFGGEGTGAQSFYKYKWKIGETCRCLIRAKRVGDRTAYAAYFRPGVTKEWVHLATFATLAKGKLLHGYYSFVEDFRRNRISTKHIRRATFGNAWIQNKDQKWRYVAQARFTADANPVMNINAGAVKNRFFLATGGATRNSGAKLRTMIRVPDATFPAPQGLPK